jgi:uncharacterized repeat protein (TIGR01451 family)
MKRSVVFAFLAALLATMLAVSTVLAASPKDQPPVGPGTIVVTNGIYTLSVQDLLLTTGVGTFTVSTGAGHPNPNQNVLYGGVDQYPWSSYLTVRVYETNTEYISSTYPIAPSAGYTLVRLDNCHPVVQTAGNTITTQWTTPEGLKITQVTAVEGTTLADSVVGVQTTILNTSTVGSFHVGVRYLWDLMIDGRDGSYLSARTPNGPWLNTETQWLSPAFQRFETTNDLLVPLFSVYGTVAGPAGLSPTPPDLFQYDSWSSAFSQAFDYTPTGQVVAGPGTDSAVAYFWGNNLNNAEKLLPGASLVLQEYLYVPEITLTKTDSLKEDADADGVFSPGDTINYTAVISNDSNKSIDGVIFTDTPDLNTTLVNGSVTTTDGFASKGNITGNSVEVLIGTIAPNTEVTITFEVTVNKPLWERQVANQSVVSGVNFESLKSDDPDTRKVGDPTVTQIKASPPVHGPGISEWGILALTVLLGGTMVRLIRKRQIDSPNIR